MCSSLIRRSCAVRDLVDFPVDDLFHGFFSLFLDRATDFLITGFASMKEVPLSTALATIWFGCPWGHWPERTLLYPSKPIWTLINPLLSSSMGVTPKLSIRPFFCSSLGPFARCPGVPHQGRPSCSEVGRLSKPLRTASATTRTPS